MGDAIQKNVFVDTNVAILTDNVKDFATFEFIATIKPKSIRKIII